MSRKEARIARQEAAKLKEAEKSARLRERPVEGRAVRVGADPGSIFNMNMTWSVENADLDGNWLSGTSRQWSENDWSQIILPKLTQFSQQQWKEIEAATTSEGRRMHHPMSTADLSTEAQERLIDKELYQDSIYRFRLGNLPRLWGFRIIAKFEIL